MGKIWTPSNKLTLSQQAAGMMGRFPALRPVWDDRRTISWTGPLRPFTISKTYQIRVVYEQGAVPKVSVLSPELTRRFDGSPIPHVYKGPYLCLYLPKSKEWNPTRSIAYTIVPWAMEWLYFYEVWHATGEWIGGGVTPGHEAKDPPPANDAEEQTYHPVN